MNDAQRFHFLEQMMQHSIGPDSVFGRITEEVQGGVDLRAAIDAYAGASTFMVWQPGTRQYLRWLSPQGMAQWTSDEDEACRFNGQPYRDQVAALFPEAVCLEA